MTKLIVWTQAKSDLDVPARKMGHHAVSLN